MVAFLFIYLLIRCMGEQNQSSWESWKTKFGYSYDSSADELHAIECFQRNLLEIARLNSIDTAHYAVNQFSDLCPDEFKAIFTRTRIPSTGIIVTDNRPDGGTTIAMTPIDYRTKGMVTPAKDQQVRVCGSCWAFSAVMAME